MRVLLQRVVKSSVFIKKKEISKISSGFLILVAFCNEDNMDDIKWSIKKILNLRLFADDNNKMNVSLLVEKKEVLIVSQFTLFSNIKKGNRPSWNQAASLKDAKKLYQNFISEFRYIYTANKIQTGIFGEDMQIELVNDGPVTIFFDSKFKKYT